MSTSCSGELNIKKEKHLKPRVKAILKETTSSSTQLFGDKLKEEMKVLSEKAISLTTDGGTDKSGYRSSQLFFFIQEGRPTTDISETLSCLPIQPTLQRIREDLQQRQATSSAVLQERTWCEK